MAGKEGGRYSLPQRFEAPPSDRGGLSGKLLSNDQESRLRNTGIPSDVVPEQPSEKREIFRLASEQAKQKNEAADTVRKKGLFGKERKLRAAAQRQLRKRGQVPYSHKEISQTILNRDTERKETNVQLLPEGRIKDISGQVFIGTSQAHLNEATREQAERLTLLALKRQLVEIYANTSIQLNQKVLSVDLAGRVNQSVGQWLEDEVKLEELYLRHRMRYSADLSTGTPGREYIIEKGLVHAQNKLLSTLDNFGYETVGDVREASIRELSHLGLYRREYHPRKEYRGNLTSLSYDSANFIYTALSRFPRY